jgi:hypothetical protein
MKRPSLATYLLGNPLVAGLGMVWVLVSIYQGLCGAWPWGYAAMALSVVLFTGGAYDRLRKYQLWKMEWEGLAGKVSWSARLSRNPIVSVLAATVLAELVIVGLVAGDQLPTEAANMLAFFALCLGGCLSLYLYRRSRPMRVPRQTQRDLPVALVLARPSRSPSPLDAYTALPDYCRQLMR